MRQQTIQFEATVEDGIIRIPEQYMRQVPFNVVVTLAPKGLTHSKFKPGANEMPSNIDEFPALLDTTGWMFDRDEANERR
jgi:hypothetical protein